MELTRNETKLLIEILNKLPDKTRAQQKLRLKLIDMYFDWQTNK